MVLRQVAEPGGSPTIVTSAGPEPVQISTESVGKTIEGAKVKGEGNDLVLDTSSFYKPTEAGSYPIVLATYEIVCSKYPDAEVATGGQGLPAVGHSTARAGLRTTATSRSRTPSRAS